LKSFHLPDISIRYNIYSGSLISSVSNSRRDWNLISFNVNSLNTLLTSKYTIPISDEIWENRHYIQQTRCCNHCHTKKYKTITDEEGNTSKEYYEDRTEVPIKEIQIIDETVSLVTSILLQAKSRKVWICPQCKTTNLITETPRSNKEYQSNATFGVIYDKPKYSLAVRASYDRLCMVWLTCFLREIDMGLMAFQKEYFDQHQSEMREDIKPISHNI
jgi:hypothetical protein